VRGGFFEVYSVAFLLATVGPAVYVGCSAYCHGNSVVRMSVTRVYCIKTAEPVIEMSFTVCPGNVFLKFEVRFLSHYYGCNMELSDLGNGILLLCAIAQ